MRYLRYLISDYHHVIFPIATPSFPRRAVDREHQAKNIELLGFLAATPPAL
jgi:hypothetical protein